MGSLERLESRALCEQKKTMSDDDKFDVRVVQGKGRGVFAKQAYTRGALVESAHCIYFPKEQAAVANATELNNYTFLLRDGGLLLALSHGSLFNHSDPPNLDYRIDVANRIIRYYAVADVCAGDELSIFYGSSLWFDKDSERHEDVEAARKEEEDDDPLPFS
jgi:tRNA-specific adenosine deaminase 3